MILIQLVPLLACALPSTLLNPLPSELASSPLQSHASCEEARRCSGGTAVSSAVKCARSAFGKAADEGIRDQIPDRSVPEYGTLEETAKECDEPGTLADEVLDVLNRLGPPAKHYDGISEVEVQDRLTQDRNYREVLKEKLQGKWFAVLLSTRAGESFSIAGRFETWKGLLDFILERDALVEVWAYGEGVSATPRRLSALELAQRKKERWEGPTFVTVTYRDAPADELVRYRVEFGFSAAETALAATQSYRRHREIQLLARQILGARDSQGRLSAFSQWEALVNAAQEGRFPLTEVPSRPGSARDLFVAFEFRVDEFGNYATAVRVYRESEIEKRIVWEAENRSAQVLALRKSGTKEVREAAGYRVRGMSDVLEAVPSPILGQDFVELRVKDPNEAEVRKWNVLEFGEPEILKQSALAKFSLINAHLEKRRKEIAIRKSNLDLIAEPIFAALNVGAGLSGVAFPLGEAARLGYNAAVVPWLIPDVPRVKEMRELFRLMAAKDRDPRLKTKPGDFLDEADFKQLQEGAKHLTDAEVAEYLQRVGDEDLKAMLRLARMQRIDARVSNLLSIMADAGKVSGWTDTAGFQRDVFNSIYFSVTGEVSIKNIIAVLVGGEVATPRSGVSLEQLSKGQGPAQAWLQYLNFTVDIRAVLNTFARLSRSNLADKELKKPFPYAPRLRDLAAYEIRIFGFPLLMFHKRGLLKRDYAAYQADYAYGLIGTRIVEHFRTREEMDREIRARRMFPLGYVRVPDGKGGWKESNLAVFAHRIPSGKYKGRTAVILYGLKAYEEHSEFVEREHSRFREFETALEQGAVIEQLVDAEDRSELSPIEFEPKLHLGQRAMEEIYSPLLGGLLELRRDARLKAWEGTIPEEEVAAVTQIKRDLAAQGIRVDDAADDPLQEVDARFYSSFQFKKYAGENWRMVRLTSIPSIAAVERELAKAEEAQRIEQIRRDALAGRNEGVILLNEARLAHGRYEIGPPCRDAAGQVFGAGVRSETGAIEAFFEQINRLPVAERARFQFNHFASTVLDLDVSGKGEEKVFVTIETPLDHDVERRNPLTGETEIHIYSEGNLTRTVTGRRFVEFGYDADNVEVESRVYANRGTRRQPEKGALIQETRTLDAWFRDLRQTRVDPHLPLIRKLTLNHVTGQITRDTYGLFPEPVESADDLHLSHVRFNDHGVFTLSTSRQNGLAEDQFQRPGMERVLSPVAGRERFHAVARPRESAVEHLRDLSSRGYQTEVERDDLIKGVSKTLVFDHANFGRLRGEAYTDRLDEQRAFDVLVTFEYRDDFHFGLVPVRTVKRHPVTGDVLATVSTTKFDPVTRRLSGTEVDYTGKTAVKTWDYRWENRVDDETNLRRTTMIYNREETSVTGQIVAKETNEEVSRFSGEFDPATKTWKITRLIWHRPDVLLRRETEFRTAFGKPIAMRVGNEFEIRPQYDASGREQSRDVWIHNPTSGQFDVLVRREDDFRWQTGKRDARVQTYVEGKPYDHYRTLADSEGRIVADGIKEFEGVRLRTAITFDGAGERRLKTELVHNNEPRQTHHFQRESKQDDGTYLLSVIVQPFWGLAWTNTYRLDDVMARPLVTTYENGESVTVAEWFPGTSIPQVSELKDRHGRPKERLDKRLSVRTEGSFPIDLEVRYKISHWGAAVPAEERAFIRGTDLPLFMEMPDERIYFDLRHRYDAPRYSVDPQAEHGFPVELDGVRRSHVTGVFGVTFDDWRDSDRSRQPAGKALVLTKVDLHGLLFHKLTRRTVDRAGRVIEEQTGRIPNLTPQNYSDETLLKAAGQATPEKLFRYSYEAGLLVERTDSQTGGRMLIFTTDETDRDGTPINNGPWREMVTRIEGIVFGSGQTTALAASSNFPFRRIGAPRQLSRNPHLPDQTDIWTAWTVTDLGPSGEKLFDTEIVFDAQGTLRTTKASKRTNSGRPGAKIVYNLSGSRAGVLKDFVRAPGEQTMRLDAGGQHDFARSDFIYFYVTNGSDADLIITDAAGRQVVVRGGSDTASHVSYWPVNALNVRWLPDVTTPELGVAVHLAHSLPKELSVRAVSVADLVGAGLQIRNLRSFDLMFGDKEDRRVAISPLFRLERAGSFVRNEPSQTHTYVERSHSNGLKTFAKVQNESLRKLAFRYADVSVAFDGLPLFTRQRGIGDEAFPNLLLLDSSDADEPRQFYTIASRDGQFLGHFRSLKTDVRYVYRAASGFEVPMLEAFRFGVLDDETAPSLMSYGANDLVTVPLVRGRWFVSRTFANFHNRIAANIFKFVGDRLFQPSRKEGAAAAVLRQFNDSVPRAADSLAEHINRLPTIAQALLPTREAPWERTQHLAKVSAVRDSEMRSIARTKLREAAASSLRIYTNTSLIPTAPGSVPQQYVETVRAADLITLAAALDETVLAGDLLEFYQKRSRGGMEPLHAWYDAQTGASREPDPLVERPLHGKRTAEAQLAVAEAAFKLWIGTGDSNRFTFGANLLTQVLRDFRPNNSAPRGIAEHPIIRTNRLYGLAFWPKAERYPLKSNARAYLLLKQLVDHEEIFRRFFSPAAWDEIREAKRDQEDWLRTHVLPQVTQTGVVPKGLFQIQDIYGKTTALAVERWTAAEDWLAFLEAADEMGIARELTRRWLENLARVHGVTVNGAWGLDWSVPLLRPDAISTELTAGFLRVARRLGHDPAADFAEHHLHSAVRDGAWPAIVTQAEPTKPLPTGQGDWVFPRGDKNGWPVSLTVYRSLIADSPWASPKAPSRSAQSNTALEPREHTDVTVFLAITGGFYLSILFTAMFWWRFRAMRQRWRARLGAGGDMDQLVPDAVMQGAEERWAKRVLGVVTPEHAERSRFSNAAVEQNFHMQLRAIYKLVLEWRRRENEWGENDPRVSDDETDDWLNGADEFCTLAGIYMRWVIKAGTKDGFRKQDVLAENEDSNHIWSRLLFYFSEYHWGLRTLVAKLNSALTEHEKRELNGQIVLLLNAMGMRQRNEDFDARRLFNFPSDPSAMDLLSIQKPDATLAEIVDEMARKLRIPGRHIARFIRKYKEFKERENLYPIHPYLVEAAKLLPHFVLMGLGAVVYYNYRTVGDTPIVRYLWEEIMTGFVFSPAFRVCGLLLLGGLVLSVVGHWVKVYRWEAAMLSRTRPEFLLDKTLTGLFVTTTLVLPLGREGWQWNPALYERAAWALRAIGFLWLGILLLGLETRSFATFLVVKGFLAMIAFAEVLAIALPLAATGLSKFLQDRAKRGSKAWKITRFANGLNITATRPTSVLWQSFRYHFSSSALSGGFRGMCQTVVLYFFLAALFFFVGAFLCQEMFPLWFTEQYRSAANGKLFAGASVFWITMYLLRYGLFAMVTGVASWIATFPIRAALGIPSFACLALALFSPALNFDARFPPRVLYSLALAGVALMFFEEQILALLKRNWLARSRAQRREEAVQRKMQQVQTDKTTALGVVYMSGDDLSCLKLTPDLLMTRWNLLRDKLDSHGLRLLVGMVNQPDEGALRKWFAALHELEKRFEVTLWHPLQLSVAGEPPRLPMELGVSLIVGDRDERAQVLAAWHVRRWLVSMMSTAGHSQDTAINLVDIALRLEAEGLSANTVFYLVQNKYDDSAHNRPAQTPYDQGELAQRNKLARLLGEVAPGARAYSVQNWTPFGFKAGGLTGTDLVYEESLKLTTMLLLDRNATVYDLDALMEDLRRALTDPEVVVIIPGRSTTNTLTSVGQGSQMVEEGHRSFLKGLMSLLGGSASESLGTGWGNILRVFYGKVQRALVNANTPQMPLTSRMRRGSSFAVRLEGLIGFGPHAVGISEDTWAVSQATHNAVAFGQHVKFLLSRAMWHKMRETWSHSEWLASFPRWSGGYTQMMHDPLMQQINDFGPLSIFAKEARANSGRFYLTALFTLLNILLMPVAIILDVTPFIQILIVLWNFGFVMNQVLTVHGLQAYLESSGFSRVTAVIGGVVGVWLSTVIPALEPLAPGLIIPGFLFGGFLVGFSRWLHTRLRDVILFGPQLVLHALGQMVRQSLEFVVSGASPDDARGVNLWFRSLVGPREDRPHEPFPTVINLRTVVWAVGFLSLLLNLVALTGLDMLNALMLLPSLLFSVSALVGPFVMKPAAGKTLGRWNCVPRLLGWMATVFFYILVSWLIAREGWLERLGFFLLAAPFVVVACRIMKFIGYRRKLTTFRNKLSRSLTAGGLARHSAERLGQQIMREAKGGLEKLQELLNQAALPAAQRDFVLTIVEQHINPLLREPEEVWQKDRYVNSRFLSEFSRSFMLSLFVLLWFFLVPVPGLFVVSAWDYRIAVGLWSILTIVGGTIAVMLAGAMIANFIEWLARHGIAGSGLKPRIEKAYRTFQSLLFAPGGLTDQEISSLYALFTVAQIYLDQRGHQYARRSLALINRHLSTALQRASASVRR